ncbi:MAG: amidohydrolase [Alicyclobacillus macrosporangiidus]|uniref:amidohydrolase n=1 Tax=Alicyclobacillus macrosporangiidus TaxID=392015 RepID=UPI0026ECE010|nr:amidohydrolase [Alicyclobacillus macrosporangiidus]MCL6599012.1 amidohydrolase [Alicyclobacillus macrosporangiidus]
MFADTVILNGQVITVDARNRIASAVAVRGNRILAVGGNDSVSALVGPDTRVIDARGRSVLPGFIDSHLHFAMYGTNQLSADCKTGVTSLSTIQERLRHQAEKTPKGRWVRGWGYNDAKLAERRHPTRWDLDAVSTEHPILLVRTCGHISVCNSRALELLGISENTPDPEGGEIGRDARGTPNGLLKESAHMAAFQRAMFTEAELLEGLRIADRHFHQAGITSVHDAGGYGPLQMRVMQQAAQSRAIKTRVYAIWCSLNESDRFVSDVLKTGICTGLGDAYFRIGPAKLFLDGSSSGPTCATRQPYLSMPDYSGIQYYSQAEVNRVLGAAHRQGWQITAHAIGDRAVEMMINCIEQALAEYPRTNHRHRIEHAGMVPPDLLCRIKKLGIVPIPNPAFFYEFGDGYLRNYGEERVSYMFPVASYLREGIVAAGGSDAPITTHNPLRGIQTAVTRQTESGRSTGEAERISVLDAIRLFTYNGAYASFEEHLKGSLEPGKLADIVVLNAPILDVDPQMIATLQVDLTMIDGEVVYARSE